MLSLYVIFVIKHINFTDTAVQMYVMSWVSTTATIGLVIDVLILLWSLADSLANINLDHLLLGFHTSLLAVLHDGGCHGKSQLLSAFICM
jgi:hypothetical protein